MNKGKNPYGTAKSSKGGRPPLLFRVPICDFEDNTQMEQQLLPYEMVVARIRNHKDVGFTHNVGLIYKDDMDRVYSLMFMQHHGELKDTAENRKLINGESNDGPETESGNQGQEGPAEQKDKSSPAGDGA